MRRAAEFSEPLGYGDLWPLLAIVGLVLMLLYYAAVTWWGRAGRPAPVSSVPGADVPSTRREHLNRLASIRAGVRSGELSAREGHQQISTVVRSYVGSVTSVPAPTMTLADLRASAPASLADAIEVMYPPEFAPDDEGRATETFDEAMTRARTIVSEWR